MLRDSLLLLVALVVVAVAHRRVAPSPLSHDLHDRVGDAVLGCMLGLVAPITVKNDAHAAAMAAREGLVDQP